MREPCYILVAFVAGFLGAQAVKLLLGLLKRSERGHKKTFTELVGHLTRSGGMPSGHAAALMAATTVAFLWAYGGSWLGSVPSGEMELMQVKMMEVAFCVLACVDCVVIYDAVNVRQAVGEQGRALNKVLREGRVRVVEGHTVAEALVGVVLGVVLGVIIALVAV